MTDIYTERLVELTANFGDPQNSPYGAVLSDRMKKNLKIMRALAYDIHKADSMRSLKYQINTEFILWIVDIMNKYILTLKKLSKRNTEGIFFNIVYCILDRWQVRYQHNERNCKLSYDKFCKFINMNTHTLSREGTIHYTVKRIQNIWCFKTNGPKDILLRTITDSIANDIECKIEDMKL